MSTIARRIRLFQGDITALKADAIVTAANEALCGGGGVDGAVHDAAGPQLAEASMALAPCPAGSARITEGFGLQAMYVIHAVGPIYRELGDDSPILASAYKSSLELATERQVDTIVFPCISTGAFGFPAADACDIAINAVVGWLRENEFPRRVIFCCYEPQDTALYQIQLDRLAL